MTNSRIVAGGLVLRGGGNRGAGSRHPAARRQHRGDRAARQCTRESAERIDATGRLIIPGLINAHTHGHGGLGEGLGDRWSLELLLNAGPWINGGRTDDDRYLSTLLSAVEMLRKGCTACYDLSAMLPIPTVAGLHEVARAYADVGMRAVISPMIADRSFYQAIPGLLEAFPPELRAVAETMRTASATRSWRRSAPPRWLAVSARSDPAGHRADDPPALLGRVHDAVAATWRPSSDCRCRPSGGIAVQREGA